MFLGLETIDGLIFRWSLLIRLFQQTPSYWGLARKGPPHRVSVRNASVCARFPGRAVSGTMPLVTFCDCAERRIHPDKLGAVRDSHRDECQSTTAAGCQSHGPQRDHRFGPFPQFYRPRLDARHVPKTRFLQPGEALEAVGITISVALLKSAITFIRARPVARPRFSTATMTSAAFRSLS